LAAPDGFEYVLRPSYLESIEIVRRIEASDVGNATLEHLGRVVEQLGVSYLQTPPLVLLDEIQQLRRYTTRLLDGKLTLSQKRRVYEILGWLSALLGHLALDLGNYRTAAEHCETALRLAEEIRAADLGAWVLGTHAMLALFAGEPKDATRLAQAGRETGRNDSVITVRATAQEARAWARLGDRARAERALGAAVDMFARLRSAPGPGILSFQAPYIPFYGGTVWTWLDRPRQAEASTREALTLCDAVPEEWPVARVSARFDLAVALSRQGKVDEACKVGLEGLSLASARPTVPTRQRAGEFVAALLPHHGLPIVEEIRERVALMPPGGDSRGGG
jgi:tetratricopeptide (TPR) repeat protein